jgi:hypothetical protein
VAHLFRDHRAEIEQAHRSAGHHLLPDLPGTVGRALPGEDMFDPKSITRFMEHLQQVGELSQGVAIGIHHENKAGDVMGSIYFDNNSDFMSHVERHGDPASESLRSGKISCVKQKDGEDGWGRNIAYKFVATEENGEGSLVVDRLIEQGHSDVVTAVNFGSKSVEPPLPSGGNANRRAELWNNMKTAL